MQDESAALIYIGAGTYLPGVPARDLTAAEVAQYGGADLLLSASPPVYKPPPAALPAKAAIPPPSPAPAAKEK